MSIILFGVDALGSDMSHCHKKPYIITAFQIPHSVCLWNIWRSPISLKNLSMTLKAYLTWQWVDCYRWLMFNMHLFIFLNSIQELNLYLTL